MEQLTTPEAAPNEFVRQCVATYRVRVRPVWHRRPKSLN